MEKQFLLIDADDTLWENNIYFEQAFDRFCALLDHSSLTPEEVRTALDEIEIENNKVHGYGAHNFVRNLRQCFEALVEREPDRTHFEEIASYAHGIMSRPIELLPGVFETVPLLAAEHELTLFTKGEHKEQSSKFERSALGHYFTHCEIVKEKNQAAYQELVARLGLDKARTWMIGNSPKSDVNPALAAGLSAVYIPHPRTWSLEREEIKPSDRLIVAKAFADLARIFVDHTPIRDTSGLADFYAGVKDKSVLITGAGRGIGKRLAIGFAAAGARIALLGRSQSELELAKLEIEHAGGHTLTISADVRELAQLMEANERVRKAFGGTDVLICAAAILGPIGPFLDSPAAVWKDAIDTNLMGVVLACRAVLPQMLERRSGKIIVLAGGGSSSSRPFVTGHAVAKTAVVRFVESLAEEIQDHNVQINCLDPGACYTSMTDEILRAGLDAGVKESEEAQRIRVTGGTPADKQIQMAIFLASPQSNHINGKLLLASEEPKKLEHLNMLPDLYTLRRQVKG